MKKYIMLIFISTLFVSCIQEKEETKPNTVFVEYWKTITSNEWIETGIYKIDSISEISDVLDGTKKPNLWQFLVVRLAQKNNTNAPYQTSHYRDMQVMVWGKIYNPTWYLHIQEKDYPGYKDCAVLCDINPGETVIESVYFDVPPWEATSVFLANWQVEMQTR